ncbi:hypothetical protein ACFPRA_21960 [Sporosarcina soli]|uniref:Uncharacterized protein n=1 Tax=Sporosarcina soli TaxID=334736 RepID=A0ABW0TT19_9BACL
MGENKNNASKEKPVKKKQSNIPSGFLLEYRIKRLLFHMGYFPKMGVVMKTSQEETAVEITDLDVYGIYMHKDFTSKTLWADCKSGGAKVHDRIMWIKGVMNTIKINDTVFVKKGVRTEVKQYARTSGIQILDLGMLEKLEKDYKISEEYWAGSWNPEIQHDQLVTLSKIDIPTNDTYKKIAKFISADYWAIDSYSRIKKIITALRELSMVLSLPISDEQLTSVRWAINELMGLFLLATLNVCKEVYYFTDSEKRETVYEGLAAGDVSNKKRKEIFDAAFRVAYSVVQSQIPDFKPPTQLPPINLTPPRYTEAFLNLISRITNNPLNYYDLLRFIDFSLMEYDLHSRKINHDVLKNMFINYADLTIGAKTLFHFVSEVTGIPRSYFQLLDN